MIGPFFPGTRTKVLIFVSTFSFILQARQIATQTKPSFVAPAEPLEKSLKEQIQRLSNSGEWEAAAASSSASADAAGTAEEPHREILDEEDERNLSILGLYPPGAEDEADAAAKRREYPPASSDVLFGAAAEGSPPPPPSPPKAGQGNANIQRCGASGKVLALKPGVG